MTENEIYELVVQMNKEKNVEFVSNETDGRTYVGKIFVQGNECKLEISFPKTFPLSLPEIRVIFPQKRFAHMGSDGKLCLLDRSSLLINNTFPERILIECFESACNILAIDINSDEYAKELLREFNSYWFANSTLEIYSALEEKCYGYSELKMYISGRIRVLALSLSEAKYLGCNYLKAIDDEKAFSTNCIVISLRKNSRPIVLKASYRWSEVRRYILENVPNATKKKFKKFLNSYGADLMRYIVLSLPEESGNVLFGFRVHFSNRKKEKLEKVINAKVEPVYVKRIDRSYMLQRSGAENVISSKSVLLMGCGSIGGYIANNLCQLGIGSIDFIDDDVFSKENVHRHFLGFDALVGKTHNKAVLLKNRLEEMYPYVDIDSLDYKERSVESYLCDTRKLSNYDLIISALGEPTLNIEINRILYEEQINTPFICCFNEPYGIGGHAIVSNIARDTCLRCLYTDSISSDLVLFRGSFVKANQNFKKNISGCSSAFVPYSCLDSQQTAIVVSKIAVKVLKKEIGDNEIHSWVGEDSRLIEEGFLTSEFFNAHKNDAAFKMKIPNARYCPICNIGK